MLIAVSGKARAGKDTFGAAIGKASFKKYNKCIHMQSFAHKLKKIAMDTFSLSYEQVNGAAKEIVDPRWGQTGRSILQKLGTAYRGIYDSYWIDVVLNACKASDEIYVITDCRYKNEADAVRAAGGIVVRINRPDEFRGVVTDPTHASEVDLDDYPYFYSVIENNREIEYLDEVAEKLLDKLFEEKNNGD